MKTGKSNGSTGKLVKETLVIVAATKALEVTASYTVKGLKAAYDYLTSGNHGEKKSEKKAA